MDSSGADSSPPAAVTPRDWCEYVLSLLQEQEGAAATIPYREMLLTYLAVRNPSAEEFEALLASWSAEAAGPLGEMAGLLLGAWRHVSSEDGLQPTHYAEVLRTVGGVLDDAGVRVARIVLTDEAVEVQAFDDAEVPGEGQVAQRALLPSDIGMEQAARIASRRGLASDADPAATDRYETRLRIVGTLLGCLPAAQYEVTVAPLMVAVESNEGYSQTFTLEQLTALLDMAPYRRRAEPPAS